MLSIIWAPTADADLEEITNYIWQHNPIAAQRIWQLIQDRQCSYIAGFRVGLKILVSVVRFRPRPPE